MERVKGFCDGCPEFKRDMVWLGTSIFVTCSCNCGECVMEEKTFDADYTTTDVNHYVRRLERSFGSRMRRKIEDGWNGCRNCENVMEVWNG